MPKELIKGEDYIINERGHIVFTKEYHLKRGYCCKNSCLNCPYDLENDKEDKKQEI